MTDHKWPKPFHGHAQPKYTRADDGKVFANEYCCWVGLDYDDDDSEESVVGNEKVATMAGVIFIETLYKHNIKLPKGVRRGAG